MQNHLILRVTFSVKWFCIRIKRLMTVYGNYDVIAFRSCIQIFTVYFKRPLILATLRYSFLTACSLSGANCIEWCTLEQDTEYLKLCTCEENGWSKNEFDICYPCVNELISCHTNFELIDCPKKCFSVRRKFQYYWIPKISIPNFGIPDQFLVLFPKIPNSFIKEIFKYSILKLQKWQGFAQKWGPCMPISHLLMFMDLTLHLFPW